MYLTWQHACRQDKSKLWSVHTHTSPNHDLYRQVQIMIYRYKHRQVQIMICTHIVKSKSWTVQKYCWALWWPQNWKCLAWPHLSKVRGSRLILVIMCLSVPFRLYSAMATCCTKQEQLLRDCEQKLMSGQPRVACTETKPYLSDIAEWNATTDTWNSTWWSTVSGKITVNKWLVWAEASAAGSDLFVQTSVYSQISWHMPMNKELPRTSLPVL